MSNKITSIRGMNDVLPEQTPLWQWLEQRARAVLAAYGYQAVSYTHLTLPTICSV